MGLRTGHDATAAAGCWISGFAARRLPSHHQDITAIRRCRKIAAEKRFMKEKHRRNDFTKYQRPGRRGA